MYGFPDVTELLPIFLFSDFLCFIIQPFCLHISFKSFVNQGRLCLDVPAVSRWDS